MLEAVDIWNLHEVLVPTVYNMFLKKFFPGESLSKLILLGYTKELEGKVCIKYTTFHVSQQ